MEVYRDLALSMFLTNEAKYDYYNIAVYCANYMLDYESVKWAVSMYDKMDIPRMQKELNRYIDMSHEVKFICLSFLSIFDEKPSGNMYWDCKRMVWLDHRIVY